MCWCCYYIPSSNLKSGSVVIVILSMKLSKTKLRASLVGFWYMYALLGE